MFTVGVVGGPILGGILFSVKEWLPFAVTILLGAFASVLTIALLVSTSIEKSKREANNETTNEFEEEDSRGAAKKLLELLTDAEVLWTLLALVTGNAVCSCIEATISIFLAAPSSKGGFEMNPTEVGLMFLVTAVPSLFAAFSAGHLGQWLGRWPLTLIGLLTQGVFMALGPKEILAVTLTGFAMQGIGMGFVDGTASALLADIGTGRSLSLKQHSMSLVNSSSRTLSLAQSLSLPSRSRSSLTHSSHNLLKWPSERHQGTGVIYLVQSVAVQLGFVVGPMIGTAIMQGSSFGIMAMVWGALELLVGVGFGVVFFKSSSRSSSLSNTVWEASSCCFNFGNGHGRSGKKEESEEAVPEDEEKE